MRLAIGLVVTLMVCGLAYGAESPVQPISPSVGSRVRIISGTANEPVIGTVLSIDVDALILRRAGGDTPSRIPVSDILSLEVSGGRKSQAGRGALIGAAVGLLPGLLVTTGDYSSDVHGDSHAATVAAIGGAGGAVIGAAIGRSLKTDKWLPGETPRAAVAAVPLRGGAALWFRLTWRHRGE